MTIEQKKQKVIAEKKLENNYYIGTSGEYLKVKFKSEKIIEKKDIIKVKAIKYEDNIIIGEAKNGFGIVKLKGRWMEINENGELIILP